MSKSTTGTIGKPNLYSRIKSSLNRLILQQSWGRFFDFLAYKLKRNGGSLVKVDPKYTSQTCSECGYISKENRLSQAKFICGNCNSEFQADYNASINILNAAGIVV